MPELILALDVGTTTARAAIFTPGGEMAAIARAPIHSASSGPGRVEQDPGRIWGAARRVIVSSLAAAGRRPEDLAAIGITTQRSSAMIWDRATGRPLTPLVVWSDLRGEAKAKALRESGYPLVALQAATKLEDLAAAARSPGRTLAWGNIDSFLIWKLSGGVAHVTDRSQAWPTGYLDLASMAWNHGLINHQGLDEAMFPRLADTRGLIAMSARRVLGAPVPITADVADQQSALIAHGEAPGTVKLTCGTSATLDLGTGDQFIYKGPAAPPFVVSSVNGETRFCLEAMVLSAGSAVDWCRRALRLGGHASFAALAGAVTGSGGAAFHPALGGLGAPHGDAGRRALLAGLTGGTSRPHLARAALEGVAFRVREAFEHLLGLTDFPSPEALGIDGGMTASDVFMQILADLLGRPIRRHAFAEATACGAAISAGRGAGLLTAADAAAFVRFDRTFEPAIGPDEAAARFAFWRAEVYRGA